MPLSDIAGQLGSLGQKRLDIDDFGGGLNLNSKIEGIPTRYLLQARNLDLSGGRCRSRDGYTAVTGTPAFKFEHSRYSHIFDYLYLISESGNKIYRTNDLYLTGTFTDVTGILPISGGTMLTEFNGALVAATPSGIYASTDGTTWALITAAVKGTMIVAWQNKLFVAGDPNNKTRVWWCNPGDYTTWTTATDWVDVREGEAEAPITNLHVTQEMDAIGRPSLLVFKRRSLHRINSASTGSFSTLNIDAGCPSRFGVCSSHSLTAFIAENGIYATNGASPAVEISAPLSPLWDSGAIPFIASTNQAYATGSKFYFHMNGWDPLTSAYRTFNANVVHLEWNAETKTWVNHTFKGHTDGVRGYALLPSGALSAAGNNDRVRIYTFDNSNPSSIFRMYERNTSTDGGVNNNIILQTPYMQLAGGTRFRIHRLRVSCVAIGAGGVVTLRVRRDGSTTDSTVRSSAPLALGQVQDADFNRLGNCRNVSFIIELGFGANFPSLYRPDSRQEDRPEVLRMLIEYTPTGLK